jgi:hypothetical protein
MPRTHPIFYEHPVSADISSGRARTAHNTDVRAKRRNLTHQDGYPQSSGEVAETTLVLGSRRAGWPLLLPHHVAQVMKFCRRDPIPELYDLAARSLEPSYASVGGKRCQFIEPCLANTRTDHLKIEASRVAPATKQLINESIEVVPIIKCHGLLLRDRGTHGNPDLLGAASATGRSGSTASRRAVC